MRTAGNEIGSAAEASTWVSVSGMLRAVEILHAPGLHIDRADGEARLARN